MIYFQSRYPEAVRVGVSDLMQAKRAYMPFVKEFKAAAKRG